MKKWQLGLLSSIFGFVVAGTAWATLGSAEWKFYRSDFIPLRNTGEDPD